MTSGLAYLGPLTTEPDIIYRLINSSGPVAVDTETISLKDTSCIGIGLQVSDEDRYYFRVLPEPSDYLPLVQQILQDKSRTKIFHSAKFDMEVLAAYQPDATNVQDTYLICKCLGIPAGLQELGESIGFTDMFSISDLLESVEGKRNPTMLDVAWDGVALKCMNDVRATWFGLKKLKTMMGPKIRECYEVELQVLQVMLEMEKWGLKLDSDLLDTKANQLSALCNAFEIHCADLGFNPASNQQLAMYLAHQGVSLPMTRSRKNLAVDEDTLNGLDIPIAREVLEYRGNRKLLSTYVLPWIGQDRAFTHFRADLSTGRLASYGRNIQNVPSKVRNVFVPDSGQFTWFDYSQIEMRLFAWISQDRRMMQAYANGEDIHWVTQQVLFPMSEREDEVTRVLAKTFNFAMVYLAKAGTLAAHTKLPYQTANRYRSEWLKLYPQGYFWMLEQARGEGSYAETLFGRRMKLPAGPTMDHVAKCRINYPIQGTAADIIKRAMVACKDLDLRVQVHDELVFDGDFKQELKERGLDTILDGCLIPYSVKRGARWS